MKTLKKGLEVMLVVVALLFSFYYTEKAIVMLEANDPIMKKIKSNSDLEEKAVDAKIVDNRLIPGYNGLEIDLEESFKRMKNYGSYNESLLVFDEVSPAISIDDYYDKYISSGNGINTNIALIFTVEDNTYLDKLINILDNASIFTTLFVDGVVLENNLTVFSNLNKEKYELELLSYDKSYDEMLFKNSLYKLETITNKVPKYCYASYDNEEVLNLCNILSMHTIIPTLKLDENIYASVKGNLRNGSIIRVTLSNNNLEELNVLINYIKQRGFTLVTLDTLLNEGRNEK